MTEHVEAALRPDGSVLIRVGDDGGNGTRYLCLRTTAGVAALRAALAAVELAAAERSADRSREAKP